MSTTGSSNYNNNGSNNINNETTTTTMSCFASSSTTASTAAAASTTNDGNLVSSTSDCTSTATCTTSLLLHVQRLNNSGATYFVNGNYMKSIEFFTECLSIMKSEIRNRQTTATPTMTTCPSASTSTSTSAATTTMTTSTTSTLLRRGHITVDSDDDDDDIDDAIMYGGLSYRRVRTMTASSTSAAPAPSSSSSPSPSTTMMDMDIDDDSEEGGNDGFDGYSSKSYSGSTTTPVFTSVTANDSSPPPPPAAATNTSSSTTSSSLHCRHPFVFDSPLEVTSVYHRSSYTTAEDTSEREYYDTCETKFLFVIMFNLALSHQAYAMTMLPAQSAPQRESLVRSLRLYELTHKLLFQVELNTDTYFEMIMIVNNISTILQELGNDLEATMCHQHLLSAVMLLVDNEEYDVLEELKGVLNNVIPKLLFPKSCRSAPAA